MKMSKSMVKILVCLARNIESLDGLKKETGLSINRCSEVGTELEKMGLAKKDRSRKGLSIRLADSVVADNFRKMYLSIPYMPYDKFLYGKKLEVLKTILYEEKGVHTIAKMTGLKERTVRENLRALSNPPLLWKAGRKYILSKKGYPLIYNFLDSLRKYTAENKMILWKFNDEEVFKVWDIKLIKGSITGLNAFAGFGVEVMTVEYCCHVPERKLSKNEIFIHGLLEVNEPRLLGIAIAFYLKNSLEKEDLGFLHHLPFQGLGDRDAEFGGRKIMGEFGDEPGEGQAGI